MAMGCSSKEENIFTGLTKYLLFRILPLYWLETPGSECISGTIVHFSKARGTFSLVKKRLTQSSSGDLTQWVFRHTPSVNMHGTIKNTAANADQGWSLIRAFEAWTKRINCTYNPCQRLGVYVSIVQLGFTRFFVKFLCTHSWNDFYLCCTVFIYDFLSWQNRKL